MDRDRVEAESVEPFIEAAVGGAIEFRERMHAASAAEILRCEECWVLVDGDLFSVRNMDDEALRQAVVEELLNVRYWERQGKPMAFSEADLVRFLPADLHPRVRQALGDPFVRSLLDVSGDGQVRIHRDHLQDAMDFAGVWHEDFEPLTEETVYRAGI